MSRRLQWVVAALIVVVGVGAIAYFAVGKFILNDGGERSYVEYIGQDAEVKCSPLLDWLLEHHALGIVRQKTQLQESTADYTGNFITLTSEGLGFVVDETIFTAEHVLRLLVDISYEGIDPKEELQLRLKLEFTFHSFAQNYGTMKLLEGSKKLVRKDFSLYGARDIASAPIATRGLPWNITNTDFVARGGETFCLFRITDSGLVAGTAYAAAEEENTQHLAELKKLDGYFDGVASENTFSYMVDRKVGDSGASGSPVFLMHQDGSWELVGISVAALQDNEIAFAHYFPK